MKEWRNLIPEHDWETYKAAGYGGDTRLGNKPALLVIDVTYGFIGREPLPLLESIGTYQSSCGYAGWEAINPICSLLDHARAISAPVYYTAGMVDQAVQLAGQWRDKHPRAIDEPSDAETIVEEIAPQETDLLIRKTKPSAFYGTPLLASLIENRVDTVIVTGGTTSGCVRATVVDAFSHGFSTIVAEDAVFDRSELCHAVNLFDMAQKYADVLNSSDIANYLLSCRR